MNPLPRMRKTARRIAQSHPYACEVIWLIPLYLAVIVAAFVGQSLDQPINPSAAALGGVIFGALIFRRDRPLAVLAVAVAGHGAWLVLNGARGPMLIAAVIALFTVSTTLPRRTAWTAGAITALALAGTGVLVSHQPWLSAEVLGQVAWVGMAVALGDAVRSRRAYVAAIEERARRAEQTREEEAERRVLEERLRIARELHDVLAHHIALINVQAQVAAHVMESRPEQAREALGHIRQAGRSALEELRTTVGLLRRPGVPAEPATEPAPNLERLPNLIASFTAAGLNVASRIEGEARTLPAAVDLSAYRIVQEALTNVRKHAGGDATARVRIGYGAARLEVEVTDDGIGGSGRGGGERDVESRGCEHRGPSRPSHADGMAVGTGHGLIGMRERAHSVGGSFRAGPVPGGGFRVRAGLPIPEPAQATPMQKCLAQLQPRRVPAQAIAPAAGKESR